MKEKNKSSFTRRQFIKASLAGAGLTLAVSLGPLGGRVMTLEEAEARGVFSPSAWVKVTPDNYVTVVVNKSEMGQGTYTALPMILAGEMNADWKRVRIEPAPAGNRYKDPAWGMQLTGGSTSVRHMYRPLREAGAAARQMLVKAASERWSIPEGECEPQNGMVRNRKTGQALTYGELAESASRLPVPKKPALKREAGFKYIGKPLKRIDIPGKVNGRAVYGIDAAPPAKDLLYVTVARPAAFGAKAVSFNEPAALKVPGVRKVVKIDRGIAVCADGMYSAWKGRDALAAKWGPGTEPDMDNASLEKSFIGHLDKKGLTAKSRGNVQAALGKAAKKVEAVYLLPYLSHANMEPQDCTAHVRKDGCDIWVPTQNQTATLALAEKITGLPASKINVHTTYLGTGLGRRSETDFVEEALQASKKTGRPVKVIYSREDDMRHDFFRPGNATRITGALDEKGHLAAWRHKIAVQSIFARAMPAMMKTGIDPAALDGVENTPYEIPNFLAEWVRVDNPVPVGFWRSVGNSHNAFTVESFMDEMAHAAGADPVEFRLALLKDEPRPRRLLELVADKAGWGKKTPKKGEALGIAHHFSFGTYVVQAAEISVDRKTGAIKVHRMVCAVDCGSDVNPEIIKMQMAGGAAMGLSAALREKVIFEKGGVKSSNFDNYSLLRMREAPQIEVFIVKSGKPLGGIGEPGVPPAAPAVANAVFKAAGVRIRRLPMDPKTVMDELKKA